MSEEQQHDGQGEVNATPEARGKGVAVVQEPTSPTGRRQAFRDLRRQLTDDDLGSAGVQKLLLDELERAESQCEVMAGYIDRFHEADKNAAVLRERLKTESSVEILFGVGLALGGAILGLAPLFWTDQPKGWLALGVGVLLVLGATVARAVKR